jgi:hypothetical protein
MRRPLIAVALRGGVWSVIFCVRKFVRLYHDPRRCARTHHACIKRTKNLLNEVSSIFGFLVGSNTDLNKVGSLCRSMLCISHFIDSRGFKTIDSGTDV